MVESAVDNEGGEEKGRGGVRQRGGESVLEDEDLDSEGKSGSSKVLERDEGATREERKGVQEESRVEEKGKREERRRVESNKRERERKE